MAMCAGLGLLCLLPDAALAARELNEFKAPQEMTPEELERSKALSRSNVGTYANQVTDQVSPIPWGTITLFALILLIATPYGLRYYRATAGWGGEKPGTPRRSGGRSSVPPRGDARGEPRGEARGERDARESEEPPPRPAGSGKGWANDETRVRAVGTPQAAQAAQSQSQGSSQDTGSNRLPVRRNPRP